MKKFLSENAIKVLDISELLNSQRDMNRLFDVILSKAMDIACCDAGTLYLKQGDVLDFVVMRTKSLNIYKGGTGECIDMPPVAITEANVCTYCYIHRCMENIPDVYNYERFNFSGTKRYDDITGYRTKSMLVFPLENNKGELEVVIQLINATDENGKIVPFHRGVEAMLKSVSSLMAIAVTNMRYIKENEELFHSLVEMLGTAIDERSPYNYKHTRNVVAIAVEFMEFINSCHFDSSSTYFFDDGEKEQIEMAAWLHDVGKIFVPLEVMDKATRLGQRTENCFFRLDAVYWAEYANLQSGLITQEKWLSTKSAINQLKELCEKLNNGAPYNDEDNSMLRQLSTRKTKTPTGQEIQWVEDVDIANLSIKYGTLNPAERHIIERHVELTELLLKKIKFSSKYNRVIEYAAGHHEKLNGKGYMSGKTGDDIPLGARLLTVVDVWEALTSHDRPYKKGMSDDRAISILESMANDGEVDAQLVSLMRRWKGRS